MKYIELEEAFELEIKRLDDNLSKPTTSDIEYWLNAGLDKFIKTRYSGNNVKRTGFEQTQKRIDDLRTLIVDKSYDFESELGPKDYVYNVQLPDDYMVTLGETAKITSYTDCWKKDSDGNPIPKTVDVLEATIENFDRQYNNSLSEYHLHGNSARPLRLFKGNEIMLYTDGKYNINSYLLTYLKTPSKIKIIETPFEEYKEMPESTHLEIVKMAAQLYLENEGNPRYNSYVNEIVTME